MKHLIIALALTTGFSTAAQAGNMRLTCKSADGSILITREKIVLLTKNATEQYDLTILNNLTGNTMQVQNEVTKFESELNDGTEVGQLKITSVSAVETIASDDGGTCDDGGLGLGFSTDSYKLKGEFSIYDEKAKTVELNCVESYYWTGNCNLNE